MQPYNAGADADIYKRDPKARPPTSLAGRGGRCKQHLGEGGEDHPEDHHPRPHHHFTIISGIKDQLTILTLIKQPP